MGPQGPSGYTTLVQTVSTPVGGHRVVYLDANGDVQYASSSNTQHAFRIAGVTTGAAGALDSINIQTNGVIEELSWTWNTSLPIYLGENGVLVQVAPTSGFLMIVAQPITPTKIMVALQPPIILT